MTPSVPGISKFIFLSSINNLWWIKTKDSIFKISEIEVTGLKEELNYNINIPIISEATEEKILDAIYDSVEEVIKKAILK